jgi:hypothetical protein
VKRGLFGQLIAEPLEPEQIQMVRSRLPVQFLELWTYLSGELEWLLRPSSGIAGRRGAADWGSVLVDYTKDNVLPFIHSFPLKKLIAHGIPTPP